MDWVKVFSQVSDNDSSIATEANSLIFNAIMNNPAYIFQISLEMFSHKFLPKPILHIAALTISKCLNANSLPMLTSIRKVWTSESFNHSIPLLKELAINSIMDSNVTIRRIFCKIFAQIISIDLWKEGISFLVDSFSDQSYKPVGFSSFIRVFEEIFNCRNYKEVVNTFPNHFRTILIFSYDTLIEKSQGPIWDDYRFAGVSLLLKIAHNFPDIYSFTGNISESIFEIMIRIPNILCLPNPKLFNLCHQLLAEVTKQLSYDLSDKDIQQFGQLLRQFIINSESLSSSYINAPLLMISEIAQYEVNQDTLAKEKEQEQIICEKQLLPKPSPFSFSCFFCDGFLKYPHGILDFLYEIMTHLTNTDIEDTSTLEPSMEAQLSICNICNVSFENVYNFINDIFYQEISSNSWCHRHAAIMLLDCLCSEIVFTDSSMKGCVLDFLTSDPFQKMDKNQTFHIQSDFQKCPWDILFDAAKCQNQRIVESSLYVISKIIQLFPSIVNQNDMILSFQNIFKLLSIMNIGPNVHLIIFKRYISIIDSIASSFSTEDSTTNALPPFYHIFDYILKQIWIFIISYTCPDTQMLAYISNAKNKIIQHIPLRSPNITTCPPSLSNDFKSTHIINLPKPIFQIVDHFFDVNTQKPLTTLDLIFSIINESAQEIVNSFLKKEEMDNSLRYTIESNFLSTITTCLFSLTNLTTFDNRNILPEELALNIFKLLMACVKETEHMLWAEVSLALSQLISLEGWRMNYSEPINAICQFLMTELSPQFFDRLSLTSGLQTIGKLFDPNSRLYPSLGDKVDGFWEIIIQIIQESNPVLLYSKADALIALIYIEKAELIFLSEQLKKELVCPSKLLQLRSILKFSEQFLKNDTDNEEEFERAEQMAKALSLGYSTIAPYFIGKDKLKLPSLQKIENERKEEKQFLKDATDWISLTNEIKLSSKFFVNELLNELRILHQHQSAFNNVIICRPHIVYCLSRLLVNYQNTKLYNEINEIANLIRN